MAAIELSAIEAKGCREFLQEPDGKSGYRILKNIFIMLSANVSRRFLLNYYSFSISVLL